VGERECQVAKGKRECKKIRIASDVIKKVVGERRSGKGNLER